MGRGWRLTKQSWSVIRATPAVMVFPFASTLLTLAAALVLLGPWSLDIGQHHSKTAIFIATAVCAYPFTVISTYFNVALYLMADAAMSGRGMTVGDAFRGATRRWQTICLWALVTTAVGLVLRALEQIPGGGTPARIVTEWIADAAWALISFFVVPAIAVEGLGTRAAMRRSASTIRTTWGETVTGSIAIGALAVAVGVGAAVLGAIGFAVRDGNVIVGDAFLAVAAAVLAAAFVAQMALAEVFRLAVFRYATGTGATGPFSPDDLAAVFKPRRRRWLFR